MAHLQIHLIPAWRMALHLLFRNNQENRSLEEREIQTQCNKVGRTEDYEMPVGS